MTFYILAYVHAVVVDGQGPMCQFHEPVCYSATLAPALNKKIELAKVTYEDHIVGPIALCYLKQ